LKLRRSAGERALANRRERLSVDYLQSGQQPVPASFVAALAPVATNATSAIANPKTVAFMENPPARQGLTKVAVHPPRF